MKPEISKNDSIKKKEKVFFRIWIIITSFTVLLLTVIISSWALRHVMLGGTRFSEGQAKFILAVAEFPSLAYKAFIQVTGSLSSDPIPLLMNRKEIEKSNWIRRFPAPEDPGYLLFSGVDPIVKHSIVKLIRISDGMEIARWDPDWKAILRQITNKKYVPLGNVDAMQAGHPILLDNGDIVFNTDGALVRLSPCQSKPVWVLDQVSHHSNEIDTNGDIWTCSVSDSAFLDNPWLRNNLRDDSLARTSTDGQRLGNHSFSEILLKNGLRELLLGTAGNGFQRDPIHLNQISIAHTNSRHWKSGDLLISAKHLSSVFLYRPSSGKIIWHQMGPWLNQHSARFVDDHRISVFSNNNLDRDSYQHFFITPGEINQVFIYNFDTRQATQPFEHLLAKTKPVAFSGGLAQVLPDGGLFIEETTAGRHLRFTKDRLLWSRINDYDSEHIGAVAWCRYLTADDVRLPLRALETKKCGKSSVAHVKGQSN